MHLIIRAIKVFFKQFFQSFARIMAFIVALIFIIVLFAAASVDETVVLPDKLTYDHQSGAADSKNKLLTVPIYGVIMTEKETDPLSDFFATQITYGYEIKEILRKAGEDEQIKGIFLHIDSPGGTVAGAKAIADGVQQYKEKTGKPVFAYISGTAASGGYWAATAADQIVADSGTSIGSIGVIFGPFKYYDSVISEDGGILTGGVVTENGIETTYITAGRSKDIGNPYRQLTQPEIASLQESVNDVYQVFVKQVVETRKLSQEEVTTGVGAMIYSEQQALNRRLIDRLASREEAQKALLQRTGLPEDDFQMVIVKATGGLWNSLLGVSSLFKPRQAVSGGCPLSRVVLAYHGSVSALCNE